MRRFLIGLSLVGLSACSPKSGENLRETMTAYAAGPYDAAKILNLPQLNVPRLLGFTSAPQLEANLHLFNLLWAQCVTVTPVVDGALSFRGEAAAASFTQNLEAQVQDMLGLPKCEVDSELPLRVEVTVARASTAEPYTLQLIALVETELLLPAGANRVPFVALYTGLNINDLLAQALADLVASYRLVKGTAAK